MANWFTAQQIASLLDEHSAALQLFAAQWTSAPEDCVQEAILELMRQPQPPRNIAAWLFYVVKCRAVSANRSDTRRRRHEGLAGRLVRVANDPQDVPFDAEELATALRQLEEQEREVVIARIWGGLGFSELGEMLGVSNATAFRRFESGLKFLRGKLEATCETKNLSKPINQPNLPTN